MITMLNWLACDTFRLYFSLTLTVVSTYLENLILIVLPCCCFVFFFFFHIWFLVKAISNFFSQVHHPRTNQELRYLTNFILCIIKWLHISNIMMPKGGVSLLDIVSSGKVWHAAPPHKKLSIAYAQLCFGPS